MVFAVQHKDYLELQPDDVVEMLRHPAAIVDCIGILNDQAIRRYFELDCDVKGLHVKRLKEEVINNKNNNRTKHQ